MKSNDVWTCNRIRVEKSFNWVRLVSYPKFQSISINFFGINSHSTHIGFRYWKNRKQARAVKWSTKLLNCIIVSTASSTFCRGRRNKQKCFNASKKNITNALKLHFYIVYSLTNGIDEKTLCFVFAHVCHIVTFMTSNWNNRKNEKLNHCSRVEINFWKKGWSWNNGLITMDKVNN